MEPYKCNKCNTPMFPEQNCRKVGPPSDQKIICMQCYDILMNLDDEAIYETCNEPSAPAMRAARTLFPILPKTPNKSVDCVLTSAAIIIDRETGVKELSEACKLVVEAANMEATGEQWEKDPEVRTCHLAKHLEAIDKCKQVIAKAEKQ